MIIAKRSLPLSVILRNANNHLIGVEIDLGSSNRISTYSVYWGPVRESFSDLQRYVFDVTNELGNRSIVCLDANAHNTLWNSSFTEENRT